MSGIQKWYLAARYRGDNRAVHTENRVKIQPVVKVQNFFLKTHPCPSASVSEAIRGCIVADRCAAVVDWRVDRISELRRRKWEIERVTRFSVQDASMKFRKGSDETIFITTVRLNRSLFHHGTQENTTDSVHFASRKHRRRRAATRPRPQINALWS